MMQYKVLTKKSVLDIQQEIAELTSDSQQKVLTDLWEEQNTFLKSEYYAIHFIEDKHYINESYTTSNCIEDTIQCLAIKDGIDVVKFDNENMGIVAYYNGHVNGFEFKEITENQYYGLDEDDIKILFC